MNLTSNELEVVLALVCLWAFLGAFLAQLLTPVILSLAQFLIRFVPVPQSYVLEKEILNDEISYLRQSLIAKESQIKALTGEVS